MPRLLLLVVMVATHLPLPTALFPATAPPSVVGHWTLCAIRVVRNAKTHAYPSTLLTDVLPKDTPPPFGESDTMLVTSYTCTELVFRANGTGDAGLGPDDWHAFTWERRHAALSLHYLGTSSRLEAGMYQLRFVNLPGKSGASATVRLELSPALGITHYLER